MTSRWTRRTLPLIAALALCGAAHADILVLKSGGRREGRVEPVVGYPDRLALITSSSRLEINRSQVEQVIEESDAVDYSKLGQQFLDAKSYSDALQSFQRAVEADPNSPIARDGLARVRVQMKARAEDILQQQVTKNAALLNNVHDLISKGQFEQVENQLDSIMNGTPTEDQKVAIKLARRDLYLAWGTARLDKLDNLGAERYLSKVLEIEPANQDARDRLLMVWERDTSKKAEVLAAYTEKAKKNPEDLTVNQKVADLLLGMQRNADALPYLKRLNESGRYRGQGYEEKLRQALEQVSRDQAARQDFDAALMTYNELLQIFPQSDRSPLAYLQYEQKLSKLGATDWKGRSALLGDLRANGMEALALQEAELILTNDPANEAAMAIVRDEAKSVLADAQAAFQAGQYEFAKSSAKNFTDRFPRFPDLVAQASDLYTKADIEAQRQAKKATESARSVAAQGDEYLAQARSNAEQMKTKDRSQQSNVYSYKQEAIRSSKRAVEAYQLALQLDPSLGPLSGADINTKMEDAKRLYQNLTGLPYPSLGKKSGSR